MSLCCADPHLYPPPPPGAVGGPAAGAGRAAPESGVEKRPPAFQAQPRLGILQVSVLFDWNEAFYRETSFTPPQICSLPPGTISDVINEHNLTVHWTEKHTHRDCALYTGEAVYLHTHTPDYTHTPPPPSFSHSLPSLLKVAVRAGAEIQPRIRSFSGTVPGQR